MTTAFPSRRSRYATAYTKRYRHGMRSLVSAEPTMRRLQALCRIGYCWDLLSSGSGVPRPTLEQIGQGRRSKCARRTAEKIKAYYDEHHMTPVSNPRVVAHAIRKGWASPLCWDDIENDDRPYGVTGMR